MTIKNQKIKMKNDNATFKDGFKNRIYQFVLRLIGFIERLPKDRICDVIGTQLLRSGTSIGANYIEAIGASSRKDFTNYFHHCLKSANESKFWLALLRDTHKANQGVINDLLLELIEISKIFGSSLVTLKRENQK